MRPFLKFTALRLGLFAAAVAVLYLLQVRGLLLALLSAFVSVALSYVLLQGPRDELAQVLAARAERRAGRSTLLQDAEAEDAEADRATRQATDEPPRDPPRSEPVT